MTERGVFEESNDDRGGPAQIPCPLCGELVRATARRCRHCGERLRDDDDPEPRRRRRREDTEGDATGGVIPYKNPSALAAYYCGVFSLISCVCPVIPLWAAAFYLGIRGLKAAKEKPQISGQVHAWIGILMGVAGAIWFLGIVTLLVVFVMWRPR